LDAEPGHSVPDIAALRYDTVGLQMLESLSRRDSTEAQTARDFVLPDWLTWKEGASHDELTNEVRALLDRAAPLG
jgi:hypothetical protein